MKRASRFLAPLSDADADRRILHWAVYFGIDRPVRRERTSIWQVTDEAGRPGCDLVGVYWDADGACLLHTRRLSDEDIVHELLHVAHPDWSESQVVEETARCEAAFASATLAPNFSSLATRHALQRAAG